MAQHGHYGKPSDVLVSGGQKSRQGSVPLGYYFDDGIRRFRWAYVKGSALKAGQPVKKCLGKASALSVPAECFRQSATAGGYGDRAGVATIRLAGLSGLTQAMVSEGKFNDGFLMVISAVSGQAVCHPIDWVEKGKSGTLTTPNCWSKIYLKEPLAKPLSTGSEAMLLPNPYRGVRAFSTSCRSDGTAGQPAGFLTCSATTSGYQLVQTKGLGIGLNSGGVTSQTPVYIKSSTLSSIDPGSAAVIPFAWSLGKAAGDSYLPINICIE